MVKTRRSRRRELSGGVNDADKSTIVAVNQEDEAAVASHDGMITGNEDQHKFNNPALTVPPWMRGGVGTHRVAADAIASDDFVDLTQQGCDSLSSGDGNAVPSDKKESSVGVISLDGDDSSASSSGSSLNGASQAKALSDRLVFITSIPQSVCAAALRSSTARLPELRRICSQSGSLKYLEEKCAGAHLSDETLAAYLGAREFLADTHLASFDAKLHNMSKAADEPSEAIDVAGNDDCADAEDELIDAHISALCKQVRQHLIVEEQVKYNEGKLAMVGAAVIYARCAEQCTHPPDEEILCFLSECSVRVAAIMLDQNLPELSEEHANRFEAADVIIRAAIIMARVAALSGDSDPYFELLERITDSTLDLYETNKVTELQRRHISFYPR